MSRFEKSMPVCCLKQNGNRLVKAKNSFQGEERYTSNKSIACRRPRNGFYSGGSANRMMGRG